MARQLILRSWLLPWQEKRLLLLPLLLFVALYTSEYLAKILGLELDPNGRSAVSRLILFVLYHMVTDALFYTFLAALFVAIALRRLNGNDVDLSQILSDLRQRARPLIALALIVEILIFLINTLLIFLQPLLIPSRMHLLSSLTLLAVLLQLLVKTIFLLALPTIINEKGRFRHMIRRSWQLSVKMLRTLLLSLIGLLLTIGLLGAAIVLLGAILPAARVIISNSESAGPLRVYIALVALPVAWSYQALLYQHARDRESADALPSNP